jgi:hypothetical protein
VSPVATLSDGRRKVWIYRTPASALKCAMSAADMQNTTGSAPPVPAARTD